MAGSWDSFNGLSGLVADTMILLTDETVLVHDVVDGMPPTCCEG